jgi:hypothetical protein
LTLTLFFFLLILPLHHRTPWLSISGHRKKLRPREPLHHRSEPGVDRHRGRKHHRHPLQRISRYVRIPRLFRFAILEGSWEQERSKFEPFLIVSLYPCSGSFSRSAIKAKAGVKTPLAGWVTGAGVVVALYALTGPSSPSPSFPFPLFLCRCMLTNFSIPQTPSTGFLTLPCQPSSSTPSSTSSPRPK